VTKPPQPGEVSKLLDTNQFKRMLPLLLGSVLVLGAGVVIFSRFGPAIPWPKKDPKEQQIAELKKNCDGPPMDANVCVRYAETILAAGKNGEAEETIDKVLEAHADIARAHAMKGDFYLAKRYGSKAEEEYNKALKLNPKDATTWEHLGDISLSRGELSHVCEQYQKAHELRPHDVPLALKLADVLGHSGEWEKVISLLSPMVSQKPTDPDLRTALGFAFMQTKDSTGQNRDLPKALSELQAAERIRPNGCKTESLLGMMYSNQGQSQKASDAYKNAVTNCASGVGANKQDLAVAHVGLCKLLKDKQELADAKKECSAALAADSTVPDAQSLLKQMP
jgi:Flp pilus assembly protein TadD